MFKNPFSPVFGGQAVHGAAFRARATIVAGTPGKRYGEPWATTSIRATRDLWRSGTTSTSIAQIKDWSYPDVLEGFVGEILLVGISYFKDAADGNRTHSCVIERWERYGGFVTLGHSRAEA